MFQSVAIDMRLISNVHYKFMWQAECRTNSLYTLNLGLVSTEFFYI